MDDYLKIISCKTAALFRASVTSGAYSVKAPGKYVKAMSDYAEYLGLAFQMRDDIFDYVPKMDVGKKLGVDILEQKITLPLIEALRHSSPEKNAEIRGMVRDIAEHKEYKDRIMDFVNASSGVARAEETLAGYSAKAVECLEVLPESEEKSMLRELALYVGERRV